MLHAQIRQLALALIVTSWALIANIALTAPVPKDGTEPFVKWRIPSDAVSNEMHDPIVVNDTVIVGDDLGHVSAFRAKDGSLLWRHEEDRSRIFYLPSSDGERVYF